MQKKEKLELQITKITGEKLDVADKKINEILISRIGKKEKKQCLLLTLLLSAASRVSIMKNKLIQLT